MNSCIHGLEKENCFYCNGGYFKKQLEKKTRVNQVDAELKEKYDILKEKFRNFRELWTEDEIFEVYSNFKDIGKKEYKTAEIKTAIQLERTKNAIRWMVLHLFSERTDLHRGIEVEKFRKMFNIIEIK